MNNRINKLLNIEYPVISAAMNWVTSAEFVAAVSNAGGMGVLGPNAGQTRPATSLEDFSQNLRTEIQKVRQLTDKPFAVNYIFPMEEQQENLFTTTLFNTLLEENVKTVVAIGFKTIKSELEKLKRHDFTVLYRQINPTVQNSIEAETLGVDALIVTGREAGGHISQHDISTFSLVQQVTSAVSIPVIAAGGIVDGKGAKGMFAMGAEGVYMGTRFIATHENRASNAAKQAILKVNSEDFLELEGANERTIATEAGKKAYELLKQGREEEAKLYYKDGIKVAILDGDLKNGTISISPAAGGIKEIKTCKEIIEEIAQSIS